VLVELVRCLVRGRHDHHFGLEKCREEAPEDHRIGDVVDLKFVEAQECGLRGDVGGDLVDGLLGPGAALPFDAVMHFEHEGMEMDPPLCGFGTAAKNRSISIDLPRPDRAAEIQPYGDMSVAVLGEAEARQPAAQSGLGPIMQQRAVEALQLFDRQLLRLVRLQQPLSAQLPIARHRLQHRESRTGIGNRHRHAGMRLSAEAQSHG